MARQDLPGRDVQDLPSRDILHAQAATELGADEALAAADVDAFVTTAVSSPGRDAWRRFRHNWAANISLGVIGIMVLMAVFAPLMHTVSFTQVDFTSIDSGPTWHHWLGTDELG